MIVYVYVIAAAIGILTIIFSVVAALVPSRKTEVSFDPVNAATLLKYSVLDNHRDVPVSNMNKEYFQEETQNDTVYEKPEKFNSEYTGDRAYYPFSVRDFKIAGSRILQPARSSFKVYSSSRPAPLQFR